MYLFIFNNIFMILYFLYYIFKEIINVIIFTYRLLSEMRSEINNFNIYKVSYLN